jgi:hypothetical protein
MVRLAGAKDLLAVVHLVAPRSSLAPCNPARNPVYGTVVRRFCKFSATNLLGIVVNVMHALELFRLRCCSPAVASVLSAAFYFDHNAGSWEFC